MNRLLERASFAISRPDLLLRKVLGKNLIEIELYEIAPYLTDSPVILEAGACDGADTVKFAQRWPDATIYAFETLIGKLFHVGYTVEGTWKLMRRHGWSCQVPVRQAIERHEAAVAVWKAEVWPQIKVPRATWAVWSHLKRSLANLAKRNISQPTALVKTRLKRMQYRPGFLGGFLANTRLGLTPFSNPQN